MKNNKSLKILAVLFAVVLLVTAARTLPPAYADKYSVGDAEISASVRNLEIDWTSGAVNIAYHSGNTVVISEKTTGVITDSMRMRWILDGDTLRIEYEQPGFHLFSFLSHEKELTVTLPQGIALDKVNIAAASGDITIPSLRADSLKLGSTSGDIRASVIAQTVKGKTTSGSMELQMTEMARKISLESTSGDITLEALGAEDETEIETTSGAIRAAVMQTGEFDADSTSGDIYALIGSAKKTKIESTSGEVIVKMASLQTLKIKTTSGDVTAYLPAQPGFTAEIKTTGGELKSQLPLTQSGKQYIAGDGSGSVEIRTTSGNVIMNPSEK